MILNEHIHHHGGSPNGLLNGITPSTDSKGEAHKAWMDVFGKSSKKWGDSTDGGFQKLEVPQNGWSFWGENPIKMVLNWWFGGTPI